MKNLIFILSKRNGILPNSKFSTPAVSLGEMLRLHLIEVKIWWSFRKIILLLDRFYPFLEPNLMDNFDLLIFYVYVILWETRLIKTNKYITNYIQK